MISKEFVLAGRAVFTVANDKGDHYTYRVGKKKDADVWFVSYLFGPDNTTNYRYLGVIDADLKFRLTAKSAAMDAGSRHVKVLEWALRRILEGGGLPDGYSINHAGRCCRCGRMLTVPESIESGIGPECVKHVFGGLALGGKSQKALEFS